MTQLLKKPLLFGLFLIFIFCLFITIPQIPYQELDTLFLRKHQFSFLWIMGIFSTNLFLVAFRQFLIYKQFRCPLSYRQVLSASLSGHLCGLFFLPLLSNILGQGFQLKKMLIPASITATTSIYERFLMAGVGVFLAVLSFFYLNPVFFTSFSSLSISFIHLCVPLGLVGIIILFHSFFAKENLVRPMLSSRNILYGIATVFCTLFSWILMSSAFSILILNLMPELPITMVLASSLVVSFLASLPISPNGWGIRELAAIKFFPALGLSVADSLGISVSIGLIGLATILLVGGTLLALLQKFQIKPLSTNSPIAVNSLFTEVEKKIIFLLTAATAISIFFQIKLEFQSFLININLADIFALTGLAIAILNYFSLKQKLVFDLPFLTRFLYWSPLAFLIAFLIGWYKLGFIGWAFYSKFLGWFVIIGYVTLGNLFIKTQDDQALKRLISLMILTISIIVIYHFFLFFSYQHQFLPFEFLRGNYSALTGLQGYALNRNAFTFQLLTMIVLVHFMLNITKNQRSPWPFYWVLSALYCAVFFTFSRAGFVTLPLLFSSLFLAKFIDKDQLKRLALTTTITLIFIFSFDYLVVSFKWLIIYFEHLASRYLTSPLPEHLPPVSLSEHLKNATSWKTLYSAEASNHERFYTMATGLKMWLKSPFFGEGLGSFMAQELHIHQRALIIHNTFIWLLAEFGLIGSSIFMMFGFSTLHYLYQKFCKPLLQKATFNDGVLLGMTIIFILMSLVHEVLYQRIFWFTLGLIAINKTRKHNSPQPL